jgi:histidinol-phosphatase
MTTLADDLALAQELADRADAITLPRFGAVDLAVSTKPDLTPVTEADTSAERALRELLSEVRPQDAVVGEEYGSERDGAHRRWIVDPIDGTKNYVRGIPVWATLVALEDGGDCTVGVVSAPALGRRWWATRGEGAFGSDALSGQTRQLAVSGVTELADAQLSFGGFEDWASGARRQALIELVEACWRTRSFGDFWAYMLLAEGALEIAIDPEASLWDLAAPQIVVEEAGGTFSDLSGTRTADGGDAIATNGRLHDAALWRVGR